MTSVQNHYYTGTCGIESNLMKDCEIPCRTIPEGTDRPGLLYAAFEGYPGLKGAHTHIRHVLRGAADIFPNRTLVTLGAGGERKDPATGVTHLPVTTGEANLLRRSEAYGRNLCSIADRLSASPPAVIHFRDIWSGIPLLSHPISRQAGIIFEVNGLPSLELASHYPRLGTNGALVSRLRWMEECCLQRACRVIAVSETGARYLRERGVTAEKLRVVPNAGHVDEDDALPAATGQGGYCGGEQLVYVGTLAPWQGIELLLQALDHLRHRPRLRLLIVTPGKKWLRCVIASAKRFGLTDRIEVQQARPHEAVRRLVTGARLSIAPLARGARNELQGCSPLKIVESMAWGTPVIAADLPVVHELLRHGETGWLVPPDSARALAQGIETLLDDCGLRERLAAAARTEAAQRFSLPRFSTAMAAVYRGLLAERGWQ